MFDATLIDNAGVEHFHSPAVYRARAESMRAHLKEMITRLPLVSGCDTPQVYIMVLAEFERAIRSEAAARMVLTATSMGDATGPKELAKAFSFPPIDESVNASAPHLSQV